MEYKKKRRAPNQIVSKIEKCIITLMKKNRFNLSVKNWQENYEKIGVENFTMKKLITLPDEIKEVLDEHKEHTGVSVTSYIQQAIFKQMLNDGLLKIKTKVYLTKDGLVKEVD